LSYRDALLSQPSESLLKNKDSVSQAQATVVLDHCLVDRKKAD
jgi:hypothetical protein